MRDQVPRLAGEEPVRLRVVELAARDGLHERRQVGRVHLVVRRHHADDLEPVLERAAVAGDDRRTHSAIAVVRDHLDARVAEGAGTGGGLVRRAVVDHEDAVDERGDPAQRVSDERLLVVRRHDDTDALALELQAERRRATAAATPSQSNAAIPPSTRPMRPATTTELRRLRAVTRAAEAGVSTDGCSMAVA